jgi:cobalt-zinc-cadmium efflux system protein
MSAAHSHASHHAHTHGILAGRDGAGGDSRRLTIALALIVAFMGVEVGTGILAHSLALLSDAAHMLTDAAAIVLSLLAARIARRPARGAMTYGLGRVEVLAAQANGVTLLVLAAFVIYEGIRRLVVPPHVHAGLILAVALAGVAVNLAAAWTLAGAQRRSLNIEGSVQHVLTDLYAFIGTAVAAVVILASGFQRADPLASLLVAALMLRSAYALLRASARVFLEAAPEGLDVEAVGTPWPRDPASSRSMTCTSGRSRRASRRSRRTCSCAPTPIATPPASTSQPCCASASASTTPRSRSTTARAVRCSISRRPPGALAYAARSPRPRATTAVDPQNPDV